MNIDLTLLRQKMNQKHISMEGLSKELGIDASTLYRKFQKDGVTLTVGQVNTIKNVLGLTTKEASNIFLW